MYLFRYINSIYLTNSVIIEFHKYIDDEKLLKNYICGSKIVDEAFLESSNTIAKVLGQLKKNKIINAIIKSVLLTCAIKHGSMVLI